MKLRPLYDKIVLERIEQEKTDSGLYIPETSQEKPNIGIIIEAGYGKFENGQYTPLAVKKGDKVLFAKFSGTEVEFGDKKYIIIRENDILSILEENE